MSNSHKPLLQEVGPASGRYGGKALIFLSLLIGLSLVMLLSAVSGIHSGDALAAQKHDITMANTLLQHHIAAGPKTFWQPRSLPFPQQSSLGHTWRSFFHPRNAEVSSAWGPHQAQRGPLQVSVAAAGHESRDLDKLLSKHSTDVKQLSSITSGQGEEYDDLWLLRFILGNPGDLAAAKASAESALKWRKGEGKPIVEAAKEAFAEATKDGGWNNDAAFKRAPHASLISPFIGPEGSHIFTVPTEWGDLCSVIRAPAIDDDALMKAVSVKQMTEWFVYVKELNAMVCNVRTKASRQMCQVITANDLNGVLRPPGADFGKALSESSKQSLALYPLLAGPTLLLNLPDFVQVLVDNFFKPLFPKRIQAKIRFEGGPLKELTDLKGLRDPGERAKFLKQIEALQPSLKVLRIN